MNASRPNLADAARQNTRILQIAILGHFLLSLLISQFRIGEMQLFISFTDTISAFVNSISGTANLASDPVSTSLILTLSWLFIVPFYLYLLTRLPWKHINYQALNKPVWVIVLGFTLLSIFVWFMAVNVPHDTGRYGKLALFLIETNIFTISLWALLIWLPIWSGLMVLTVMIAAKLKIHQPA